MGCGRRGSNWTHRKRRRVKAAKEKINDFVGYLQEYFIDGFECNEKDKTRKIAYKTNFKALRDAMDPPECPDDGTPWYAVGKTVIYLDWVNQAMHHSIVVAADKANNTATIELINNTEDHSLDGKSFLATYKIAPYKIAQLDQGASDTVRHQPIIPIFSAVWLFLSSTFDTLLVDTHTRACTLSLSLSHSRSPTLALSLSRSLALSLALSRARA